MRYLKVRWIHRHPDDPVLLYHEVDDQGWERRKVELFADGRVGFASACEGSPATGLSIEPLPTPEEIAADPQFEPVEIEKEEFERIWSGRTPAQKCV